MNTLNFYNKKICIVGNNDGPLILLDKMKIHNLSPKIIILNKKINLNLMKKYKYKFNKKVKFLSNEDSILGEIKKNNINLVLIIFSNIILKKIPHIIKTYNFHLSYLPQYRGRHPIHWGILNGEKNFGISCHRVSKKIDNGPIIWRKKICFKRKYLNFRYVRKNLIKLIPNNFFAKKFIEKKIVFKNNYFRKIRPSDSKIIKQDLLDKENLKRKIFLFKDTPFRCYIIKNTKKYYITNFNDLKKKL